VGNLRITPHGRTSSEKDASRAGGPSDFQTIEKKTGRDSTFRREDRQGETMSENKQQRRRRRNSDPCQEMAGWEKKEGTRNPVRGRSKGIQKDHAKKRGCRVLGVRNWGVRTGGKFIRTGG